MAGGKRQGRIGGVQWVVCLKWRRFPLFGIRGRDDRTTECCPCLRERGWDYSLPQGDPGSPLPVFLPSSFTSTLSSADAGCTHLGLLWVSNPPSSCTHPACSRVAPLCPLPSISSSDPAALSLTPSHGAVRRPAKRVQPLASFPSVESPLPPLQRRILLSHLPS